MKKSFFAALLSAVMLLSLAACGAEDTQTPDVQQPSASTQQTTPSAQTSAPTQTKPKVELPELLDTISAPLTLTFEQANAFSAFLDAQQPEYELFDLYDFDAEMTCWEQLTDYAPTGPGILQNGSLDREALLRRIQQNNADFLAATQKTRYTALSDGDFGKVFNIVCTGIEQLLAMGTDEALLDEKLGDLKVLSGSMAANGMMTHQDTILAINLKSVEAFQNATGEEDKFTGTILHEVMHLGQISSDAERTRQGFTVRVGPCIQWEGLTPYALFWEWYVEGSAEHLKMDIRGDATPSVYEPYVRTLNAMSVALLPTYDPATIYQQTLNADLSQFFALFGADAPEEQREIMYMMCALDVALAQPDTFTTAYKERYGTPLGDRSNYNEQQISNACLTLSKVFYRQLCDMAAQETSLAEVFSLITAFETQLSRTARYPNNMDRNRPLIDGYHAMQTAFFEQLAACAGMTAEDVRGQYLAWYYSDAAVETPHLPAARQEWLRQQMASYAEQFWKQKAICEFAQ